MALIVQKFGGSSVADRDRIFNVARIVANTHAAGNDVVVVVSAQGDTTDDLIAKAAALRGTKSVDSARMEALVRSVKEVFEEYLSLNPRLSKDVVYTIITNEDAALLCDYIPANLLLKYTDKQALLNEGTVSGRLEKLLEILRRETGLDPESLTKRILEAYKEL